MPGVPGVFGAVVPFPFAPCSVDGVTAVPGAGASLGVSGVACDGLSGGCCGEVAGTVGGGEVGGSTTSGAGAWTVGGAAGSVDSVVGISLQILFGALEDTTSFSPLSCGGTRQRPPGQGLAVSVAAELMNGQLL